MVRIVKKGKKNDQEVRKIRTPRSSQQSRSKLKEEDEERKRRGRGGAWSVSSTNIKPQEGAHERAAAKNGCAQNWQGNRPSWKQQTTEKMSRLSLAALA